MTKQNTPNNNTRKKIHTNKKKFEVLQLCKAQLDNRVLQLCKAQLDNRVLQKTQLGNRVLQQ